MDSEKALAAFSEGFTGSFLNDWPFMIIAGVLYFIFREFVKEEEAARGPFRGPFRPSFGFCGSGILILMLFNGPWWARVGIFVGLIVLGIGPTLNTISRIPLLGGCGYLIWSNIAPGSSLIAKIGLLVLWEVVFLWVFRSLQIARTTLAHPESGIDPKQG